MSANDSTQEFIPLTRDQLLERATELSALHDKLDTVREEKASAMKDFKDAEAELNAKIRKLAQVIRQKGEYRDRQASIFDATPRKNREDA